MWQKKAAVQRKEWKILDGGLNVEERGRCEEEEGRNCGGGLTVDGRCWCAGGKEWKRLWWKVECGRERLLCRGESGRNCGGGLDCERERLWYRGESGRCCDGGLKCGRKKEIAIRRKEWKMLDVGWRVGW